MKASPASFTQKSKEGEIINFIQVDSPKISNALILSPGLLITPIQIIVYTYMLFDLFGYPFLFGFGTLLIFMIINFVIQNSNRKLVKKMLSRKDKRLKVTTETVNHLKILKLYAWEDEFLNRVI